MADLTVDPAALVTAAMEIQQCASNIGGLHLSAGLGITYATQTFGGLAGSFRGATDDMSDIASSGDSQITRSMSNASKAISAFAELVINARDTTVDTDQSGANRISSAIAFPSRTGPLTDHPVPLEILLGVTERGPR